MRNENLIERMAQFELGISPLPTISKDTVIEVSIGLTSGKNTGKDFYEYLSCFFKVVHPNGDRLDTGLYPLEVMNRFKLIDSFSEGKVRENLIVYRKEAENKLSPK